MRFGRVNRGIIVVLAAACLLGAFAIRGTFAGTSASSQIDGKNFDALTFTEDTNDRNALRIARKFMMQEYDKYDMDRSDMPDLFAHYINLRGTEDDRFIVAYSGNEYGDCFAAGCDIRIYENYEGTKWKQLLQVTANQIFIPKTVTEDAYGDILLITMFENPTGRAALWRYSPMAQQYTFVKRL